MRTSSSSLLLRILAICTTAETSSEFRCLLISQTAVRSLMLSPPAAWGRRTGPAMGAPGGAGDLRGDACGDESGDARTAAGDPRGELPEEVRGEDVRGDPGSDAALLLFVFGEPGASGRKVPLGGDSNAACRTSGAGLLGWLGTCPGCVASKQTSLRLVAAEMASWYDALCSSTAPSLIPGTAPQNTGSLCSGGNGNAVPVPVLGFSACSLQNLAVADVPTRSLRRRLARTAARRAFVLAASAGLLALDWRGTSYIWECSARLLHQ